MKKISKNKCPSCGVLWTKHLGIMGTCKKLRIAKLTIQGIKDSLDILPAKYGGWTIREIRVILDNYYKHDLD